MVTFEIGEARSEGDAVRIAVRVPEDCSYFAGHFEGRAMLPGVAQVLGLAHAQAQVRFGPLGPALRLVRTKFQAVVLPGDALSLVLTLERGAEETKVRFRIERGGDRASAGTLVYAPSVEQAAVVSQVVLREPPSPK